jgi:hypothetical protein
MADSTNPYGEIENTDGNKVISGTSGSDKIVIPAVDGVASVYGGGGNDTFLFKASSFTDADDASGVDVRIYDFHGAGGWAPGEQDFLAFSGFGAGSTLTLATNLGNNGVADDNGAAGTLYYYTLHDTATGNDYTLLIKSINDKAITTGDYNFYSSVAPSV